MLMVYLSVGQMGHVLFYLTNLVTNVTHCLAVLRKGDLCSCGCKGWCSLFVIQRIIGWSFEHLARGTKPNARHDDSEWLPTDGDRQAFAGECLSFRVAVLFLKCDLMEISSTLGMPGVAHHTYGCPKCTSVFNDRGAFAGLSPISAPWGLRTWGEYTLAADRCEFRVLVTDEHFPHLRARMKFDRRSRGSHGRALIADYNPLGLLKNDRLEPSIDMPCLVDFDVLPRPFWVTFWRQSSETLVRHRNPLFSETTGITPSDALVPDWLHALSLGEFQFWINRCWHAHLDANVFQSQAPTIEGRKAEFIRNMKALLFAWYARERTNRPHLTCVQDITVGMFSDNVGDDMGMHGGEANYVLEFTVLELMPRFGYMLSDLEHLRFSGDALWNILKFIRSRRWGSHTAVEMMDFVTNIKVYCRFATLLGLAPKPKRHQLIHMGHLVAEFGSPSLWGCWTEEGLNRWLAKLCNAAHRAVWAHRVLEEFEQTWGPGSSANRPVWLDLQN